MAVGSLVVVSAITAWACAWICGFVLDSFQDSNAMALLITDAGTKADDKNLERNLTTATNALRTVRDLGWALGIGSITVGGALGFRVLRAKQPHKTP